MHPEEQSETILARARRAVDERELEYARFLYLEALRVNPQDNTAREELHKLMESMRSGSAILDKIKFTYYALKILANRAMANYCKVIDAAENLLEINEMSEFGLKSMMHAAYNAGYYKLAIFVSQKVIDVGAGTDDMMVIAKAFLQERIFDKAAKIAKEIAASDPENEEAKDILWKASVEKHMNSEVQLVTAGMDRRFVPPKIDADKIFIASHKEADGDKKNGDKKSTEKK
jgi:tetratricopeptide (TPR) repeat protein